MKKVFFMSMNNAVFLKNLKNVRKHRIIKIVITERRRIYLVSERKYHTTKFFTENVLAIEMKKKTTEILMTISVCLGLSLLELGQVFMYEFWCDYVKVNYGE